MKLKIKPSARIKIRYLLLEAKSKKQIEKTILDYIGVLGWAEAAPYFVEDKKKRFPGKIVLAVDRKALNKIRAAFELAPSRIKILRVSGTLKSLSK